MCAAAALAIFPPLHTGLQHGHQRSGSQTCRSGCDPCLSYPPDLSALLGADDLSFPRQLAAMGDSDEEMQLINDFALLDSQLEAAGCPCKEKMYAHLFENFNDKPLAKRSKLWRYISRFDSKHPGQIKFNQSGDYRFGGENTHLFLAWTACGEGRLAGH